MKIKERKTSFSVSLSREKKGNLLTVAIKDEGVDRVDELLAVVDRGAADCFIDI